MPDQPLDQTIRDNANGPAEAHGDSGGVKQHPLKDQIEADRFLPYFGNDLRVPHTWFFDGHEHVDPLKESSAQALRLANHTTTYADEYARRGLDWETQLRQRAKELALMTELGLTTPGSLPDQSNEDTDAERDAPPPEED